MALFEKTHFDMRSGRIMNATLERYLVSTNADIPNVELVVVEEDDQHVNAARTRAALAKLR